MKLKQITAIFLTFIIVFSSFFTAGRSGITLFFNVSAEDLERYVEGTVGQRLHWVIDTHEKLLTISVEGNMPSFSNDTPPWRTRSDYFNTVVIEDGCLSIGANAFYDCSNITSITIPGSVISIGDSAFSWCSGLTSITIPDSVKSIGDTAFAVCSGLTSITIPDSVTSIGSSAFSGCTGLTSVTIPDSVTSIGYYAFLGCSGLTSVNIPESVTSIGYSAFSGCTGLTGMTIGNSVTSIDSYTFSGCSGLTSITIPDSVTSIGYYAFRGCTGLTSVTIPESVTSIGDYAFSGCTSLEFLTVYNRNCNIYSNAVSVYTTLCGYPGSTAEKYANDNGLTFHAIDEDHEHIYDSVCDSVCNYCGAQREVPPHNFGDEIIDTAPDCRNEGRSRKICAECGAVLIIVRPPLGHDLGEKGVIIEPTCSTYGISGQLCTRCGTAFNTEDIPPAEHEYGDEPVVIKNPTCNMKGREYRACVNCGARLYSDIPVTEHIDKNNDDLCDNCHCPFSDNYIAGGELSEGVYWKLSDIGELIVFGEGRALNNGDFTTSATYPYSSTEVSNTSGSTSSTITIPYGGNYTEPTSRSGEPYSYLLNENSNYNETSSGVTRPANDRDTTATIYLTTRRATTLPQSTTAVTRPANDRDTTASTIGDTTASTIVVTRPANDRDTTAPTTTVPGTADSYKPYASFVKKITVKEGVTEIGYALFNGFYNVTEIDIADSVTSLGNYAFSNCKSLETLTIPAGVSVIGRNCFYGCDGIKHLTINNNVRVLGERAFANLKSLEKLEINADDIVIQNPYYADVFANAGKESEGINLVFGDSVKDVPAFLFAVGSEMSYPNIKSITFPAGLERIGESAFERCGSITSVSLPQGVKYIGRNAFSGCNGISGLNISQNINYIGEGAFSSCLGLSAVNYNAVNAYTENAFANCRNVREINIGNKVQRIPAYCFSGCTNLKYARIPDTVIDIDPLAFYNCGDVAIVCDDGSYANAFASVNGLRYILNNASGTAFEIKNSTLISYDGTAKNIVLPSEIKAVNYDAFKGNSKVELIELPYSVNKIYAGAFSDCSRLKKVIIPFTVTSIADNAFEGTSAKIYCYYGSYAYDYAVKNSIPYELITAVFADESVTLYNGGTYAVEAEPSIVLASGLPMVLSSDNPGVASIDSQGKVTARAPGTASIKACTQSGNLLGEMTVKVSAVSPEIHIRNYKKSIDVSLRTTVILHAQGAIPEDCRIRWFSADGVYLGEGDTYKVTEAENTFSVYAAIVDGSGKTIAASPVETVNVKSGFFQKLIAFFRKLLRRLPTVDQ